MELSIAFTELALRCWAGGYKASCRCTESGNLKTEGWVLLFVELSTTGKQLAGCRPNGTHEGQWEDPLQIFFFSNLSLWVDFLFFDFSGRHLRKPFRSIWDFKYPQLEGQFPKDYLQWLSHNSISIWRDTRYSSLLDVYCTGAWLNDSDKYPPSSFSVRPLAVCGLILSKLTSAFPLLAGITA